MIKVYGKNCIHECIRSQAKINKVFILDVQAKKDDKFLSLLKDKKIPFEIVNKGEMDSLFGNNHQGYGCYRDDYKIYDESVIDLIEGDKHQYINALVNNRLRDLNYEIFYDAEVEL
jgi:tRNA G18 (ribose-2'-O)-methylase SpoU